MGENDRGRSSDILASSLRSRAALKLPVAQPMVLKDTDENCAFALSGDSTKAITAIAATKNFLIFRVCVFTDSIPKNATNLVIK